MTSTRIDELLQEIRLLRKDVEFLRTRCATYIGSGIALAYMSDETPIYVNSEDFGGPANLINGGLYEEDNLAVLTSFVTPDTVFLDVGANVGFFSLKIGHKLLRGGKVHAFEPHPMLAELTRRSVFLNGLRGTVEVHEVALSDSTSEGAMYFPVGHLGGGTFVNTNADLGGTKPISVKVETLDRVLGTEFRFDLAKIDVEGHELQVLRGMEAAIRRSSGCKILFEKLGLEVGYEEDIENFFENLSYTIWQVGADAVLSRIELGSLERRMGYFLAVASRDHIEPNRRRFNIFPSQLYGHNQQQGSGTNSFSSPGPEPVMLFHGPYWFLQRGVWRVTIKGSLRGDLLLRIACRFGHVVGSLSFSDEKMTLVYICETDLIQFECIGLSQGRRGTRLELEAIEFVRIG